jgi:hypothetical protein
MAEVIIAVAVIYFILGGDNWNPKMWAVFVIVSAWIIIMNVRREVVPLTEKSYLRWKQQLGLLMILALLISPLWADSWWPFIIGIILGMFWFGEYRQMKTMLRNDSDSSGNSRIKS